MGGVDLFDQLIQYYPFARRTRRWTHKFLKYLLQLAIQNSYVLYCGYTSDQKKMSHLQFMEMAGQALVTFNPDDWPSTTSAIARAPALPVEERADSFRRQRHRPPAAQGDSSGEEAVDDPQALDDDAPASPPAAASTPTATPPAAATPPLAAPLAATPPADAPPPPGPPGDMPPPSPASRRIVDPVDRLRPGNHILVQIQGPTKQKRCRVCQLSGVRRDTRFECQQCRIALCRINDCLYRYHSLPVYWRTPPRGVEVGERTRHAARDQE